VHYPKDKGACLTQVLVHSATELQISISKRQFYPWLSERDAPSQLYVPGVSSNHAKQKSLTYYPEIEMELNPIWSNTTGIL